MNRLGSSLTLRNRFAISPPLFPHYPIRWPFSLSNSASDPDCLRLRSLSDQHDVWAVPLFVILLSLFSLYSIVCTVLFDSLLDFKLWRERERERGKERVEDGQVSRSLPPCVCTKKTEKKTAKKERIQIQQCKGPPTYHEALGNLPFTLR